MWFSFFQLRQNEKKSDAAIHNVGKVLSFITYFIVNMEWRFKDKWKTEKKYNYWVVTGKGTLMKDTAFIKITEIFSIFAIKSIVDK